MSTQEPIISVSGLRGIVGKTLTNDVATRYVRAFLGELPAGPILVTRDGRANGPPLATTVQTAVTTSGRDCLYGDVAATPTTGVLVRQYQAAGGIQISASHNPPEYNGLKLFAGDGRVIPADRGQRVLDRYLAGTDVEFECQGGETRSLDDAISAHLELISAICDVERVRRRKYRVLLDANHGAGSVLGRPFLEHLGCRVATLGRTPDGLFSHPPEPTEANLASVLDQVEQHSAHVGFCQDPDADRLAVIDERARYLGEEYTLAMCVDHVLRYRPGPIVTNCSSSRMSEDLAIKHGVPFFRSQVGEANVVDCMLAENAVLGGEGNGGVIDPRVVLVRDSFVGMALVLDAMAARESPVSALADELPRYAIHKSKIELPPDAVADGLAALERRFTDAAADRLDGLRLDWESGAWLLVRPSNTEPIVRAIAEAPTLDEAMRLCDAAASVLSG